ncbi:MAG: DUF481 domain-containing protein [Flavobacteriales bacterium]|nr:DUF481 domain-containing protein [Flavobacteriales bacterium]
MRPFQLRSAGPWLGLLWSLLAFGAAAQKTDTIFLFNGDRIIGEMKDLKLGLLRVKTDYMSTVYVEWDQMQTLRTDKRCYVRLRSGAYFDGYLLPSPRLDHIYIRTKEDSIHVQLIDITTLYRLDKGIWPRTDGSLNAGYSYQQSNQLSQLNLNGNALYRADHGTVSVGFSSISTVQPDVEDNRKQDATLGWEQNLWGRWTSGIGVGAESNTELDLGLRMRVNLSLGNYLVLSTHTSYLFGGGAQANRERSGEGEASDNLEVFLGNRLRFKTYRFPKAEVTIDLAGYYGVTIRDRWRFASNAFLRYEVMKDLQLGLEFYEQFDSKPLDGGPALNDWRVATTVGYIF